MTTAAILWNNAEQNSDEWLVSRLGCITASRASDARAKSDGLTAQQRLYVDAVRAGTGDPVGLAGYKKAPTSELIQRAINGEKLPMIWSDGALTYARDLARERLGGGRPQGGTTGFAARVGHEQEPEAVGEYEATTGEMTEAVGFAHTADGRFGASPDRMVIGQPGCLEVKTMVSTGTLWDVFVDGDVSAYRDQCLMQMWLLRLQWVDLCLWVPDLRVLRVVRIERDEAEMEKLEADLIEFDRLVESMRVKLAGALGLPLDLGRLAMPDGLDEPEPARPVVSVTTPAAVQEPAPKPVQVLVPEF